MSSIQQAVANDIHRDFSRPLKGNPVVQNHRSQRDDGNVNMEMEIQRKAEADLRKQKRIEEGGRSGGFNDRQEVVSKGETFEGGFDERHFRR